MFGNIGKYAKGIIAAIAAIAVIGTEVLDNFGDLLPDNIKSYVIGVIAVATAIGAYAVPAPGCVRPKPAENPAVTRRRPVV